MASLEIWRLRDCFTASLSRHFPACFLAGYFHCFAAGFYHQVAHQESLWLEIMLESFLLITVTYYPSKTTVPTLIWILLAHRLRGEASQNSTLQLS